MVDFKSLGSIQSYTKNMDMEQKVSHRKKTADFRADGYKSLSEAWHAKRNAENKALMESLTAKNEEEKAEKDTKLEEIKNKYIYGGKLSSAEEAYLEQKAPDLAAKLKAEKAEQKSFEREISRAKTKDEVQRIKMSRTAQALSTVTKVMNDPVIPQGKKLAICIEENRKAQRVRESMTKFIASGAYEKLPTDQEKWEAEHQIKEAEEAERTEGAENGEETKTEEAAKTPDEESLTAEEAAAEAKSNQEVDPVARAKAKAKEKLQRAGEAAEQTLEQARHTQEAEKTRRAKRQAAMQKHLESENQAANVTVTAASMQPNSSTGLDVTA